MRHAFLAAPFHICAGGTSSGIPAYAVHKSHQVMERHKESVRRAHEMGIKIAMGTDCGTPFNVAGTELYVADTNNHKIRLVDLKSHAVKTVELAGISVQVLTSTLLVTAGLLCLALYFAGVGSREVVYRRRSRR